MGQTTWICTHAPDYAKNTINRYCIKEENMVGDYKIDPSKYDLINMILLCLDKDGKDVKDGSNEILKLLRVLLSEYMSTDKRKSILVDDFNISMKRDFGEELNVMCNLGEGIRERALDEGKELNQLENIKNLMKNLKITFEEAAKVLELSDADRESLAAKI